MYIHIHTYTAPLTGANTTAVIFIKSTESVLCPACVNFLVSSLTHQGSRLKVIRFLSHCKCPKIRLSYIILPDPARNYFAQANADPYHSLP